MDELQAAMKVILGNTFAMYFKAHSFHWNVEGIYFKEYHGFFGDLYDELFAAVDPIAEHIRTLETYAPSTLDELMSAASVETDDTATGSDVRTMVTILLDDNEETLNSLKRAFDTAVTFGEDGVANFIADRIDAHNKHGWMLKSCLKGY